MHSALSNISLSPLMRCIPWGGFRSQNKEKLFPLLPQWVCLDLYQPLCWHKVQVDLSRWIEASTGGYRSFISLPGLDTHTTPISVPFYHPNAPPNPCTDLSMPEPLQYMASCFLRQQQATWNATTIKYTLLHWKMCSGDAEAQQGKAKIHTSHNLKSVTVEWAI